MWSPRQGGAVARNACRLALLTLLIGCAAGCRRSAPSLPVTHQYVRLDALLPMHPAWPQVQALDAAQRRFAGGPAQAATLKYPQQPLPEPFAPPITVPPSLAAERDKRVQEDALRYVQQTEQALKAKNVDIMNRFARREKRQTEANYRRALAERAQQLSTANEQEAAALQARIDRLGFKLVANRSQIAAYSNRLNQDARNPILQDVVRQEALISEQMNALEDQRKAVLARDVRALAVQQLAAQKKQWEADSAARVEAQRAELDDSVKQQVEQARARLKNEVKPIPALASAPLPPAEPNATPLPLPLAPDAPEAIRKAQTQLTAATAQERKSWQAQRESLLSAIRADTTQAVAQIARQKGWHLVPQGHAGTDVTAETAGVLRAQWRQDALSRR